MARRTTDLDARIRRRHLLKHPFYRAWSRGEVPMATLQRYAEQYYQFERNFPRYVAAAYARLEDPRDRKVLLENLIDEEGRSPTHPELWAEFASAIGVSRRRLAKAVPSPATRALLRTYERLAVGGSAATALGALYGYESIFPEISAEKSRGLREQYGITGARAHEFFRVHTVADVEHSAAERRTMRALTARDPRAAAAIRRAADATVDAWWSFLDEFAAEIPRSRPN